MFIYTLDRLSKVRTGWRIGDFGNFLNGFSKSPRLIVLNID